ncbi:hypothetical protein JG687_00009709 [Phytophthora cactorum]|uniref:BED-type domain-containing protein n=1 Tax=Phytophthora cactorum TaxID=29920 RepID=A0A8T1U910_9STRA|nr:hypothetical protein JG687_00009709 [Phytophthora cactorum]
MPKNADICRMLFSALPDHYFKCNYCNTVRRQLPCSGYGNLISHLRDKHPDYEADYLAHASSLTGNIHSFGFVDNPTSRSMSRLKPVSSKTLQKYLAATTRAVEKDFARAIPPIFGVIRSTLDEVDLIAASRCAYIRNIFAIFGHSVESLKFLVGANCATKQVTATLLGVPLVSCASYRFNLATESFLAEHEDLVGAPAAHRRIAALVESLKTFNSVCKKMQEETVSRGTEADLTPEELQALHPFELEAAASEPTPSSRSSRARTRARSDAEDFATALLHSRPIPELGTPRYNPILVMTPQRASLLPVNFEMIVFLRANRRFWDANALVSLDVDDTDDN